MRDFVPALGVTNERQPGMSKDFQEIGHSGGKITFNIKTDEEGRRAFQVGFSSSRPVRVSLVAVYALPQGMPVETIQLGGIGQPWNPPPFPGCFPVLIASDSEGHFGHNCPQCSGYWRSGPWPSICPYCGAFAEPYQFLSQAQLGYVHHYCNVLSDALDSAEDGSVEIDMDAVADAAGKDGEKPSFYVSEESQQRKFRCSACDEFNDILGRFGYCSQCGTRNDLAEFESHIVPVPRTLDHRKPAGGMRTRRCRIVRFAGRAARTTACRTGSHVATSQTPASQSTIPQSGRCCRNSACVV